MRQVTIGVGMGDAIRAAAVLRAQDTSPLVVRCEWSPNSGAYDVMRNFTFVRLATTAPMGVYAALSAEERLALQDPAEYIEQQRLPARALVPLHPDLLRTRPQDCTPCVSSYTVVQPHTRQWRELSLPVEQVPWGAVAGDTIVLLGSVRDATLPFATGLYRRVVDLRGKLTVAQAMAVVAGARLVVGVDSWAVILGGLLGKPCWQFMHPAVYPLLGPVHSILFPTITNAPLPESVQESVS